MSTKKTILLNGIKKGQLFLYFATTQAANTVKLYDSPKLYFANSKATTNMEPSFA